MELSAIRPLIAWLSMYSMSAGSCISAICVSAIIAPRFIRRALSGRVMAVSSDMWASDHGPISVHAAKDEKSIRVMDTQPSNVLSGRDVTPEPLKLTAARAEQQENTPLPSTVSDAGIVTETSDSHRRKA
ncbi:hypothetical protein IMSAGC006_01077 [Muribaculaceae bacterium]|nr:hypothetical protein IMSAGC006_01077 [Muribaculaceae bacterium]